MTQKVFPPSCAMRPHEHTLHGDTRPDPFYWLREKSNPQVLSYLEEENKYADTIFEQSGMNELTNKCYDEFLSRIRQTDEEAPHRKGKYFYYSRTVEGKEYPIYCRRAIRSDVDEKSLPLDENLNQEKYTDPEQILLDLNLVAKDLSYCELGAFEMSPCQTLLAYSIDSSGDELYDLHILSVPSEHDQAPTLLHENFLQDVSDLVEWSADSRSLCYIRLDDCQRPYQLYSIGLGAEESTATLLLEEEDERFHMMMYRSLNEQFVIVALQSQVTSEDYLLPTDQLDGPLHCLWTRRDGEEYEVEVHGNTVFLLTNGNDQRNFTLLYRDLPSLPSSSSKTPLLPPRDDPSWNTLIEHDREVLLSSVLPFKNFLVVAQRYDGLPRVQVFPYCPETGAPLAEKSHFLKFPEEAYSCHLEHNQNAETDWLRVHYSSFVTPQTAYDYHMDQQQLVVRKQKEILGDYDPSLYVVERCHAKAADGTDVPVSLVRRRDCPMDGTSKCYLTGYGYVIWLFPGQRIVNSREE